MNSIIRLFLRKKTYKITSHRPQTHRRDTHKAIFFDDPFLFHNLILSRTSFVNDAMKQSVFKARRGLWIWHAIYSLFLRAICINNIKNHF